MNGQLIVYTEKELAEMHHNDMKDMKRGLFVKTSKSLTKTGLILMWAAMLLMGVLFIAQSNMLRLVCFGAFALMYLFYIAAVRNGCIFEYIAVEQNHTGRQSVFVVAFLAHAICFIHLAIYGNPIVLTLIGISTAVTVTALRFVGEKK